jgi:uncharacterized protein with NRDE domain
LSRSPALPHHTLVCLILFAHRAHPAHPLVLAANRDELHTRPTAPAAFWDDHPDVFAGRDLAAGGTWLGVTRRGRFAALTNVRRRDARREGESRGHIVRDILTTSDDLPLTLERLAARASGFPSFNLIAGDGDRVFYATEERLVEVPPGVHGLSNDRLDVPWPKVTVGTLGLRSALDEGELDRARLFELLSSRRVADVSDLPDTGLPPESERLVSAPFIVSEVYGTCSSTVLTIGRDGTVDFEERSFASGGEAGGSVRRSFARE